MKKKWLDRLQDKKKSMQDQMQRGRERTEQMKAEKRRKKLGRAKYLKPGTFRYGLHYRQGVGSFMKDVKERRKQRREEKRDSES